MGDVLRSGASAENQSCGLNEGNKIGHGGRMGNEKYVVVAGLGMSEKSGEVGVEFVGDGTAGDQRHGAVPHTAALDGNGGPTVEWPILEGMARGGKQENGSGRKYAAGKVEMGIDLQIPWLGNEGRTTGWLEFCQQVA
jgi:hypothetical protein